MKYIARIYEIFKKLKLKRIKQKKFSSYSSRGEEPLFLCHQTWASLQFSYSSRYQITSRIQGLSSKKIRLKKEKYILIPMISESHDKGNIKCPQDVRYTCLWHNKVLNGINVPLQPSGFPVLFYWINFSYLKRTNLVWCLVIYLPPKILEMERTLEMFFLFYWTHFEWG